MCAQMLFPNTLAMVFLYSSFFFISFDCKMIIKTKTRCSNIRSRYLNGLHSCACTCIAWNVWHQFCFYFYDLRLVRLVFSGKKKYKAISTPKNTRPKSSQINNRNNFCYSATISKYHINTAWPVGNLAQNCNNLQTPVIQRKTIFKINSLNFTISSHSNSYFSKPLKYLETKFIFPAVHFNLVSSISSYFHLSIQLSLKNCQTISHSFKVQRTLINKILIGIKKISIDRTSDEKQIWVRLIICVFFLGIFCI